MTPEEAAVWEATVLFRALHSKVLVVANTRIEGTWKAYCRNVPGQNHAAEVPLVLEDGAAVDERIARVLFPSLADLPYTR